MSNREFEYFNVIVQEGTLSKAAERLYISQSSLSKFLLRLETRLGVKLLERSTTPVKLTPAGEKYLEYSRKVSELESRFLAEIHSPANEKLTLGITPWLSSLILPKILSQFKTRYPHVELGIIEDVGMEISNLLKKKRLDIGITAYPSQAVEGYSVQVLDEQRMLILAAKEYGLVPDGDVTQKNTPKNPYQADMDLLIGKRIITPRIGQKLNKDIQLIAQKYRLTSEAMVETANMDNLLRLADTGYGIAILPEFYVLQGQQLHNVHYLWCEDDLFTWTTSIYRKENYSPAQRFLGSLIVKSIHSILN